MGKLADSAPLAGLSVLVLEDEFFIAFALKETLEKAGAQAVVIARSLQDATEQVVADVSAAILDIRLPDGTSFDLAKELQAKGIAITFHSGHSDYSDVEDFELAEFCPKPAVPEQIVSSVLSSLQKLQENP